MPLITMIGLIFFEYFCLAISSLTLLLLTYLLLHSPCYLREIDRYHPETFHSIIEHITPDTDSITFERSVEKNIFKKTKQTQI